MARTNVREPYDRRAQLPRGIRPIRRTRTRSAPPQEDLTQPASMARTNIRHPNDHRPLPPGIGAIPPPPCPCTRTSTRAATHASIQASVLAAIRASTRPGRQPRQLMPPARGPTEVERLLHAQLAVRDDRVVASLAHVRSNAVEYESRYPFAVQVRTRLGVAKWTRLEFERIRFGKISSLTRRIDREEVCPPWALDEHVHKIKAYVRRACGQYMADVFEYYHENLKELLEEEEVVGLGIQDGVIMREMREMFHHRPYVWFIYNTFFPIRGRWGDAGRMNWEQLKDWMIWTLKHPMEEPSWFCWMRAEERVPLKQATVEDILWNAAMIEMIEDVAARLGA